MTQLVMTRRVGSKRVGIGRNALSAESINHPFQVFLLLLRPHGFSRPVGPGLNHTQSLARCAHVGASRAKGSQQHQRDCAKQQLVR